MQYIYLFNFDKQMWIVSYPDPNIRKRDWPAAAAGGGGRRSRVCPPCHTVARPPLLTITCTYDCMASVFNVQLSHVHRFKRFCVYILNV